MTERLDLALSQTGWKILERLHFLTPAEIDDLKKKMRTKGLDPDLIAAVATQFQLRNEARKRLGIWVGDMVFTREGLEQATPLHAGSIRAKRFMDSRAKKIADLGCGLGFDSFAFVGLGMKALAVDRDEVALAAATVNLRVFPDADTMHADVEELDIEKFVKEHDIDAIYADPMRRDDRGRIQDPEKWSPPLSTVLSWAQYVDSLAVRVAPSINYASIPSEAHATWTSIEGEVVDCCLWLGKAVNGPGLYGEDEHGKERLERINYGPGRSAYVFREDGSYAHSVTDISTPQDPSREVEPAQQIGRYIFEPDAALIRAGAIGDLCDMHNLAPVGQRIAYLTGDEEPGNIPAYFSAFEVIDTVAMRSKQIKQVLRDLSPSRIEIKKRGVDISPEKLQKELLSGLKKRDGEPLVILCTPTVEGRKAIIARRKS